jgi:hypothetical protein
MLTMKSKYFFHSLKIIDSVQFLIHLYGDLSLNVQRVGKERSLQLARMTSEFILRRTSQVNKKYLPPKGNSE